MASLDEINAKLPRVSIKGKEYIQVNARVLAFRELYPEGRIETQLINDDGKRCTFKAIVYDNCDRDVPIATGYAFEDRTSFINKTSYIENCETSAVGRALAFCGIGSVESIASADEVQGAINQQEQKPNSSGRFDKLSALTEQAVSKGIDKESIAKWFSEEYGHELKDATNNEIRHAEDYVNALIEKAK